MGGGGPAAGGGGQQQEFDRAEFPAHGAEQGPRSGVDLQSPEFSSMLDEIEKMPLAGKQQGQPEGQAG